MDTNLTPQVPSTKISRLSEALINQIAAGEVVERPASVIKELIENCIDARSRRIDVLLKDGGIGEIAVIDDGMGMSPEDLKLCIERHTTSKIARLEDLESISSFGFRGEALSSIASVSEVEIRSRTPDSPKAYVLKVNYGEIEEDLKPTGAQSGTAIYVRNLFKKVPARQKFLRSVGTEFSHCARVVKELALGNPSFSFYLSHQEHLVHTYVSSLRETRFHECLKVDWEPIHIQEEGDGIQLEAFLSPGHLIGDRGEIFLFVNGRIVRNRVLLSAVKNSYATSLGPHHTPSGALYLDIRKDWIDVNVHPQKLEVRLLRQEMFYQWILASIRKRITQPSSQMREMKLPAIEQNLNLLRVSEPSGFYHAHESIPTPRISPQILPTLTPTAPDRANRPSLPPVELGALPPRLRYLGQVKASYLVCEDETGVILVDQHALHEKMRYEELQRQFSQGSLRIQQLLVPQIIHLSNDLHALLEENQKFLNSLGFDLESYGSGDVALKSLPELLQGANLENLLKAILQDLQGFEGNRREALDKALHPVFATIACHSVVRANQSLSKQEAENLLGGLEKIQAGWTCPHGRPVLFRLTFQSIEKHFERV